MDYNSQKVFDIINDEQKRQKDYIELIASENFVSENVMKAAGSVLTNKYAEGYPEKESVEKFIKEFPDYVHSGSVGRYYGGCENIDRLELFARYMFQKVFNTDYHVNVQPHSGSSANQAAYMSVLEAGDTILSMSLENGAHLTHGSSVNFSGKQYNMVFYNVDSDGYIDYDDIERKIKEYSPKLVLAGASAYSRIIDFKRIRNMIDACENKPYFMVDMAHIAGLVAAGDHPSPFGIADIITTTTHKTLRGARGGLIFCRRELAKKVDRAVFPGCQGGGLQHIVAGKAVAACEALSDEYKNYIHQVVKNSHAMCEEFKKLGYDIVTGGTDNHLFLIDFSKTHPLITGKEIQNLLDENGITLNKNCVPNEKRSPQETSGVRIGTAAMTTKGFTEKDFIETADRIDKIINEFYKKKNEG